MSNRPCGLPGCNGIVRDDVCSQCGPRKTHGWRDDRWRGSRIERGYDKDWMAMRATVIRDKTKEATMLGIAPYPICEICSRPIEDTHEVHVDHIMPFDGLNDPLRLLKSNLRVLHAGCHMRRHRVEQAWGEDGSKVW